MYLRAHSKNTGMDLFASPIPSFIITSVIVIVIVSIHYLFPASLTTY